MPQTPHVEKHFTASETVRDIVIGMSDGLTVPFALAAGHVSLGRRDTRRRVYPTSTTHVEPHERLRAVAVRVTQY